MVSLTYAQEVKLLLKLGERGGAEQGEIIAVT